MSFTSKHIAVIGMARTGLAVAEVMTDLEARVTLWDTKPEAELSDAIETARKLGAEFRTGTNQVELDGVDLIVPSPGVPAGSPVLVEARRRGVEVIAEIELAYRLAKAPIVAITGTNGKTTTTVLTGKIFEADRRDTYIAGNVVAGDIRMPLVMAAHRAGPDSVIVAEISTFQLEWISSFRPKVAMLLNVTVDHMDRHASFEEYSSLKARIFANQTDEDFAVINSENPFTASLRGKLAGRVLEFARCREIAEGGFLRGDELIVRIGGIEKVICARGDIPLRGEHNVENVLAAGCAAAAMGAGPRSILKAVREFKPIEHRLEPVAVIDGVEYINNSMCTNVDAAVRSIEAIDEPQIVIAGGRDKGGDYAALGRAFAGKAKHVVLIGEGAQLIEDAARGAGFGAVTRASSMADAVEIARRKAEPGDVIVLTPCASSFDMFASFEHRGQVFKEIVKGMEGNSEL